jgi:exopolyphosphatase/guanosine-5'-triphosphate,3'-diphosphate pyrophosphatase
MKFPSSINPSIVSILDRFKPSITIEKKRKTKLKLASTLYSVLQKDINDNKQYEKELLWAVKLSSIGQTLTIYRSHQHAFYIAMQELNYGFTHEQILLISSLLRMFGKELLNKPLFEHYKPLLPEKQTILWLSFIYTLTVLLHEASNSANITFTYENKTLRIYSNKPLYLAKEKVKALEKPIPFAIIIVDESALPENKILGI